MHAWPIRTSSAGCGRAVLTGGHTSSAASAALKGWLDLFFSGSWIRAWQRPARSLPRARHGFQVAVGELLFQPYNQDCANAEHVGDNNHFEPLASEPSA